MARYDSICKPRKDRNVDLDPELIAHIRSIGLATVEDYLAWCAAHGFSRRTDKHWRVRLKERTYANRAIADSRLAQKKQEQRKPEKIIDRIFTGELKHTDVSQPHLKAICRAYDSAQESRRTRLAFAELMKHVGLCSDLMSSQPVVRQFGWQAGNNFVDGLLALARHARYWLRPVSDWKPQTHNARRQFASLARHLFADWPVPTFMDSVWFAVNSRDAARRQSWFLHIGSGQNIRTADLPLPYTKRMAHQFMQAPADFTVEEALRRGQIHGLGGGERLAVAINGTRLGTDFEHDDFWTSVLQFFIAHPMLDLAHVGPIIDYIHQQRFVSQDVFVAPGRIERKQPAQPNFTMKGRTPASLLRQVETWHGSLAKSKKFTLEWLPSGIGNFEFVEGTERGKNLRIWTITELLNSKALIDEGHKMRHCVGTYGHSCARGICSIWTMESETFEGQAKVLTIEVRNASRLICQVRGKRNVLPDDKQKNILRQWAAQAGLTLAKHV